uniref:Uncharacterized protein n=1 Tax=Cyclophora tenuis TaxID=216820 RepID=A0A7S1D8I6_CYCTE|mmetsp:Transcript_4145/g.7136  ORF Transcript_4145/g.7136 Transcript_4145/m.7136 type:complete len:120 (+) Transcript_4145:258-617(+)
MDTVQDISIGSILQSFVPETASLHAPLPIQQGKVSISSGMLVGTLKILLRLPGLIGLDLHLEMEEKDNLVGGMVCGRHLWKKYRASNSNRCVLNWDNNYYNDNNNNKEKERMTHIPWVF